MYICDKCGSMQDQKLRNCGWCNSDVTPIKNSYIININNISLEWSSLIHYNNMSDETKLLLSNNNSYYYFLPYLRSKYGLRRNIDYSVERNIIGVSRDNIAILDSFSLEEIKTLAINWNYLDIRHDIVHVLINNTSVIPILLNELLYICKNKNLDDLDIIGHGVYYKSNYSKSWIVKTNVLDEFINPIKSLAKRFSEGWAQ